MQKFRTRLLFALAVICAVAPALAGSIAMEWDPLAYADLAGYRIYYGTAPDDYTDQQDVGVVTSASLTGLANCTEYYVAVKALDLDGDVSAGFSNEIAGYPRPLLSAVLPPSAVLGVRTNIVVTGANFLSGATLEFDDVSITIHSVTVQSCTQLSASITAGSSATTGPLRMTIRNPDQVFGSAAGLLTILPAVGPSVLAVLPANLSDDVPVATRPTVTFSSVMTPATITLATVTLIDADGDSVAQASGSPSLSADGRTATIVPASNLAYDNDYRIEVRGGAVGVRDAAGFSMPSDFIQVPGFTTSRNPAGLPAVLSVSPASQSIGVPVNVHPTVTFSEVMDRSTLTPTRVAVLDIAGNALPQANGSPVVSADGTTATLYLVSDLADNSGYRIRVQGGDLGVRDLSGDGLATTFVQIPGFTTASALSSPPMVLSAVPAEGSTEVPVGVRPLVAFNEPMQAASITPATVALLDRFGGAVDQQYGSPILSADGTSATVIPAARLPFSSGYRVQVLGGAAGVRDLSGDPLEQTFLQQIGFWTAAETVGPPRVTGVVPPSQTTRVNRSFRPAIYFSEPVDPASVTPLSVYLLDYAGRSVPQASGSPTVSADGMRATILPASILAYNSTYRVRVLGGTAGVRDLSGNGLPGTYTQASGFTTRPDEHDPVLSYVGVTPESTTAEVVWITDEAADSRVFYRKESDPAYQPPVVETTRVTAHALRILGLSPATRYAFYVESTDGAGNVSSSSEGSFGTLASPYVFLTIEAESGRLTPPVRASSGTGAFRGAWIDTAAFTPAGRATAPSGMGELDFDLPVAGTWTVWARLLGTPGGAGSWFESIDGAARRAFSLSTTGEWEWVPGRTYTLAPGAHVLELGGLKGQARADRVVITNDPTFVATEQP